MPYKHTPNTVNKIDYSKVGGPYYRVFVNGNSTSLPEWLAKQIKSIEITEIDAHNGESQSLDMAIITLIDAYENVTDTTGQLVSSNTISGKPGNVLDLVLTGNNLIRTLTQAEINARKQAYVNTPIVQSQNIITTTNNTVTSASSTADGQQLLTLLTALPSSLQFINANIFLGNITPIASTINGVITNQLSPTQIIVSGLNSLPNNQSIKQAVTIQSTQPQPIPLATPINNKLPKFLFQEGNTFDIEWGYRSSNLKRKMRFVIQFVEYDAPESSSPEVKIYGIPQVMSDLGKLYPTKGFNWSNSSNTTSGNVKNNDVFAGDIIKTIAKNMGYGAIVSNQQNTANRINTNDVNPEEFSKTITSKENIYAYMQRLANQIGFHFFTAYNFNTSQNTIFFLSDEDYSKYSSFHFVWKGPNTLLTSYKINSDFSRLHAGAVVPVGTTSNPDLTHPQVQSNLTYNLYTGQPLNANQISTQITQTINTGTTNLFKSATGISLYTPVDQTNANKRIINEHLQKSEDAIILTGTLIGHPKISPCIGTFSNIGSRYSGRYMLINVKHIIDNSGYKIQFTAKTNVVSGSLLGSPKQNGDKDLNNQPNTIPIRLETGETLSTLPTPVPPVPGSGTSNASNFNSIPELPGKITNTNGSS